MKKFTAAANDNDVRLSRFVQRVTKNLPTSVMYKSFRNKRIKVNGKKGVPDQRLVTGDVIELYINDEFFPAETQQKKAAAPKAHPLTIVYEDANIAVIHKPVHILCHSDRTGDRNIVDDFTAYLAEKGEYHPEQENRFSPALCNRLDRGTEGLVIAAKTYSALRDMNKIIHDDLLKKEYYTITVGTPKTGRFTAWWSHDENKNKVYIHAHEDREGTRKEIITDVDVLQSGSGYSLCKIGLVTGRTHQIRAHLAFLGHPIIGDVKYGSKAVNEKLGLNTQALCAVKIRFLDIPEENSLHYLQGLVVKLNAPKILEQYAALSRKAE